MYDNNLTAFPPTAKHRKHRTAHPVQDLCKFNMQLARQLVSCIQPLYLFFSPLPGNTSAIQDCSVKEKKEIIIPYKELPQILLVAYS